jgi:quercetin dioxygenase-like cupin family protein
MSNAVLGAFRLDDEIARFRPESGTSGRRAETLIKTTGLRVVLVTMNAGAALHEHSAPGPITIHALRGHFTVRVEGTPRDLPGGELISVQTGIRHAVEAVDDGAFLLTIGSGAVGAI